MVKKLIEQENILVNGKAKKISYKVQKGDIVEVNIPKPKEIKNNEKNNILIDSLDIVKKMRIMRTPVITGEIANV